MLARLFARRYLFSPKSRSVTGIIAGISVVAFAMPVAAMIILLSVLNGFGDFIGAMSSVMDADLTITAREGQTFETARVDSVALARTQGVDVVAYLLEQQVLIEHEGKQTMATLRGMGGDHCETFSVADAIVAGSGEIEGDRLVLGRDMARSLGIRTVPGTQVAVYTVRRGSFSSLLPVDGYSVRRLEVGGVFSLDAESESNYAITSLDVAQELLDRPDRVSAIAVRTGDMESARTGIERLLGNDFSVRTRDQMNETVFRLVAFEKWGIFFISLLVLVLASFSVVGTLVMLMIEKREDMTTLRALGADTQLVRSIFVREGWLIGGLGAAIGAVLGVGFCLLQQHFGLIRIPVETLLLDSYPIQLRAGDLLAVAAAFCGVIAVVSQLTVRSVIKK